VREEEIEPEVGYDMWARDVSEGRGKQRTSLEIFPGGLWAYSGAGPDGSPRPILFFCSFTFLFLISDLIHNFCKNASNQFKPISNFF
jgi:hypothetical protein